MTDVIGIREKSKKRFIKGIRSVVLIKSDNRNDNVLRPDFGGQLKPVDTNTARTSGQLAGRVLALRRQEGQSPEQENECRSQEKDERGHGDRSDPKDE